MPLLPRRTHRMRTNLSAALQSDPHGPQSTARIADVSASGLRLESVPRGVAKDEPVFIQIPREHGRGRVSLLGRVAWVRNNRSGVEAGVAIEAILPHHRQRLDLLLRRLQTA